MEAKERAARSAIARIENDQILGFGTGSTVAFALQALAQRIRDEGLRIRGVPTSLQTQATCEKLGIPLTTLAEHPALDLTFDGADQVDDELQCIKGYGGALLREKIVARASRRLLIMVDDSKLARRLDKPVPVEVLPFGLPVVRRLLEDLGRPVLRTRGGAADHTDNGNVILDVDLGPIHDPAAAARVLDALPGVVGHGLFVDMATELHVGSASGIRVVEPRAHRA